MHAPHIATQEVLLPAKKTLLSKFIKTAGLPKAIDMLKLSYSQIKGATDSGDVGARISAAWNAHFATVLAMAAIKKDRELALRIIRTARKLIAFAVVGTTEVSPADALDGGVMGNLGADPMVTMLDRWIREQEEIGTAAVKAGEMEKLDEVNEMIRWLTMEKRMRTNFPHRTNIDPWTKKPKGGVAGLDALLALGRWK